MANESKKPLTLVGQKMVGHSKEAEFSANRGLVVELFPFIFEASERMSARGRKAVFHSLRHTQNKHGLGTGSQPDTHGANVAQ